MCDCLSYTLHLSTIFLDPAFELAMQAICHSRKAYSLYHQL
jgi:hypothetical protein